MKPTNHLRWKQKEERVPANPGVYGDFSKKYHTYNVLEQFWQCEMFDLLASGKPFESFGEMLGIWQEIEVVK